MYFILELYGRHPSYQVYKATGSPADVIVPTRQHTTYSELSRPGIKRLQMRNGRWSADTSQTRWDKKRYGLETT